jgi:hypothetical protein
MPNTETNTLVQCFRYEVLPCDRKEREDEEEEGRSVRDPDYEIVPSGASELGRPREPDYETLPHRLVALTRPKLVLCRYPSLPQF